MQLTYRGSKFSLRNTNISTSSSNFSVRFRGQIYSHKRQFATSCSCQQNPQFFGRLSHWWLSPTRITTFPPPSSIRYICSSMKNVPTTGGLRFYSLVSISTSLDQVMNLQEDYLSRLRRGILLSGSGIALIQKAWLEWVSLIRWSCQLC